MTRKEPRNQSSTQQYRVICPACSKWTVADTFADARRQFALHLACEHPNLSTSVTPVAYTKRVNLGASATPAHQATVLE